MAQVTHSIGSDGHVAERPALRITPAMQEMLDVGAGRVVPAYVSTRQGGYVTVKSCSFIPLHPEEGRAARYFTCKEEVDGTVYFRPEVKELEEAFYVPPGQPDVKVRSAFIPVNRGPVTMGVCARSDVFFWQGAAAQRLANEAVETRTFVLPESVKGPYALNAEKSKSPVTAARSLFGRTIGRILPSGLRNKFGME